MQPALMEKEDATPGVGGEDESLSAAAFENSLARRRPFCARCCAPPSVVGRQRWARCALTALRLSYLFVFAVAVGALWLLVNSAADVDTSVRVVGGIAVCLALPLSLFDVHAHLSAMVSPLQVRYVRILLMVPIYAFQSYLALFFEGQRTALACLRELYEAMVIYNMYALMVDFLGGGQKVRALLAQKGGYAAHVGGLQLLPLCRRGWSLANGEFLQKAGLLCLQYVVVRVILALATAGAAWGGVYCEGDFSPACAYPYVQTLVTLSQGGAIYGMLIFWWVLRDELRPLRPLAKLACVKTAVFFSFWLSLAMAVGVERGWLASGASARAQDLAATVLMAALAVAHHAAFGLGDFVALGEALGVGAGGRTPAPAGGGSGGALGDSSVGGGGGGGAGGGPGDGTEELGLAGAVAAVMPRPRDFLEVPGTVAAGALAVLLRRDSGGGAQQPPPPARGDDSDGDDEGEEPRLV
jgi:hypothetical protein